MKKKKKKKNRQCLACHSNIEWCNREPSTQCPSSIRMNLGGITHTPVCAGKKQCLCFGFPFVWIYIQDKFLTSSRSAVGWLPSTACRPQALLTWYSTVNSGLMIIAAMFFICYHRVKFKVVLCGMITWKILALSPVSAGVSVVNWLRWLSLDLRQSQI